MTKKHEMKDKLEKIYAFIGERYVSTCNTPTIREICAKFNIKSTSTAHVLLKRLQSEGLIEVYGNKSRGIKLLKTPVPEGFVEIPLAGKISAGLGNEIVIGDIEGGEIIPSTLLKGVAEYFMLKVEGVSMVDAGILEGDFVIIKKQPDAENGQIVAAIIDEGNATIKRFYKETDGKIRLHPENKAMRDIFPKQTIIAGVAVSSFRKYI
ncbi:MAG: transcriptional repressor LexA [Firmicutes bacterium]|nr:transcriptional repressor LexA [Bacillota bacterium]